MKTFHFTRFRLLFALMVLFNSPCSGEVTGGCSVGYLTALAHSVGEYQISDISNVRSIVYEDEVQDEVEGTLRADLKTNHKGTCPKETIFRYLHAHERGDTTYPVKPGDKFVVFFIESEGDGLVVFETLNLSHPATKGLRTVAFDPDFSILRDGERIISIVKATIASGLNWGDSKLGRNGWPGEIVEVPWGTEAHDILYRNSRCYLRVVPGETQKSP